MQQYYVALLTQSNEIHGPYSWDEAETVAKDSILETPHEVVLILKPVAEAVMGEPIIEDIMG